MSETFDIDSAMGMDWPSFEGVINTAAAQENEANQDASTDTDESGDGGEFKADAFAGALNVLFTIAEQATSIITGIDFEFDDKGKDAVIDAALPVLEKHGDSFMGAFGNYIEEATLIGAVIALVYVSRKSYLKEKALVVRQRELEQQQGGKDGKETQAATVSESR